MNALALVALVLAGAGSSPTPTPTAVPTPAPAAAPPAAAPAGGYARTEIARMLDREVAPLQARAFKTPAGIEGKVEGAAPPQVKADGEAEQVEVSLGTAQTLSCTVFAGRMDMGGAVWRFTDGVRKNATLVSAMPTGAAVVGGSALLFVAVTYRVDGPGGPLVGLAKLAVYTHDAHSLLCVHDEVGYAKSFERIAKGVAGSLRGGAADERAGARFAEVELMRVGDVPIGFTERVVWDRKAGGQVVRQHAAQLLPRGPAELFALDGSSEEVVDGQGLLEEGVFSHAANGEVDATMKLTRRPDGTTYGYEGEKDGKRLEGAFPTQAGLSTDLWFARRLHAKAPAVKELRHEAYSMEANPVGALPVVYRADPAAGPRRVQMELGPIRLGGELDADGLLRVAEIPVGSAKLVVERAWSRGAP